MALSSLAIQATLEEKLTAEGFELTNPDCATAKLTKAIADTLYFHLTTNAEVHTAGGPTAQIGTIS